MNPSLSEAEAATKIRNVAPAGTLEQRDLMRRRTTGVLFLLAIVAIVAALCFAVVWRPAIPLEAAQPSFPPTEVRRGAQLAAIGNCITCHTKPNGFPFAGGRAIATPFGAIYSVNVTPDRDTGIGGWSEPAFGRAMKSGVSRDGHHLYPAFPYDHMTQMRDEDIRAVYAFMMTRQPVRATAPRNDLPFPFNVRALIAGWKLLFLNSGVAPADTTKSQEWNRGAYLVEGLAHCGACHTPRNSLGAEERSRAFAGGESDGWIAPALNGASPAAVPWDAERLHDYLSKGFDPRHGIATGPMAPVVENLANAPDPDIRAIATYVASVVGAIAPQKQDEALKVLERIKGKAEAPAADERPGAEIYAGACAQCHGEFGRKPANPALNLTLSSVLRMPRPDNAVRIVRDGIHPAEGAGPIMPSFAMALTDQQLVTVIEFLRSYFAGQPPWTNVRSAAREGKQAQIGQARSAQ